MNRKPVRSFASALLLAAIAQAAIASPAVEKRSITVSYADLDLTQQADAHILYRRILAAAAIACDAHHGRDPARLSHYHACRDAVVARTVAKVNRPLAGIDRR
jgi:UrcA family protein